MGTIILNSILSIIFPIIIINQFVLHLPAVEASYVLSQGDTLNSLNPSSVLASANGMFTLGFFTGESTYLGIWYTNDDNKVWVANRDNPIIDVIGLLMIDKSGYLKVISNITNTTVFNVSKQVVGSGNNTRAVLEDSGNFVLYDKTTNQTLWQSFDYPTDILLPGMKVGYNLTTGKNWTLTSWFSDEIPASGDFSLRLEQFQNSPQLVIYRRGKLYWTSGQTEYDIQFNMQFNIQTPSTLVSDASGMYLAISAHDDRVISFIQLTFMGQILTFDSGAWLRGLLCYQTQTSSGELREEWLGVRCAISSMPECRSHYKSVGFQVGKGDFYGGSMIGYDNNPNISLSDCMERCWNDCKCNAFSSSNFNGTGCQILGGDVKSSFDKGGMLQIGVLDAYKHRKSKIWIWILVSTAGVLICALTAPILYRWIRGRILQAKEKKRRDEYIHQLTGSDSFNYSDALEKGIKDAPDIKIFSLKAILAATNSFSIENKLGQGGYGPVYKGKLFDGREIAIKRLSKTSGQGKEEFKSELILISKLQHTNLVRLYGCCIHQEEKMLIYEFMPNKSLDFFLFAEDKKETLDWRIRFNIIEGIAQGLLYLHKYSRMKVIHRDLKASNILLDENMNPKIADFGMARNFQPNETEATTIRIVGTYGYMAPEYVMEGTFSIKSDIFSFGVLIIEIVSGKRNSRFHDLVRYAWELWKRDSVLELKDEALDESFDLKQLFKAIHVGLLCVQDNADDRPTMLEVISMLSNEVADIPNPERPLFVTGKQPVEVSSSKNIPVSVNGLSITMMEAR